MYVTITYVLDQTLTSKRVYATDSQLINVFNKTQKK